MNMVNNQDNTKIIGGDVTLVLDDKNGSEAHKNNANGQDNTKKNGGDVALVIDDEKGIEGQQQSDWWQCNT